MSALVRSVWVFVICLLALAGAVTFAIVRGEDTRAKVVHVDVCRDPGSKACLDRMKGIFAKLRKTGDIRLIQGPRGPRGFPGRTRVTTRRIVVIRIQRLQPITRIRQGSPGHNGRNGSPGKTITIPVPPKSKPNPSPVPKTPKVPNPPKVPKTPSPPKTLPIPPVTCLLPNCKHK